jgi:hypothetical protein
MHSNQPSGLLPAPAHSPARQGGGGAAGLPPLPAAATGRDDVVPCMSACGHSPSKPAGSWRGEKALVPCRLARAATSGATSTGPKRIDGRSATISGRPMG